MTPALDFARPDIAALRRLGRALSLVVLALCVTNWVGWATRMEALTRLHPAWEPMRPWTALCLALLAIALLLQWDGILHRRWSLGLVVGTGIFSAVVLAEYLVGGFGSFDTWWFHDAVEAEQWEFPGRPSQGTLAPLMSLALGIGLLPSEQTWARHLRLLLISVGSFLPGIAFIGLAVTALLPQPALTVVGIMADTDVRSDLLLQISPVTALAVLLLAASAIFSRTDAPPLSQWLASSDRTSESRLLLVILGFPLAVWAARAVLLTFGASHDTALILAGLFSTFTVASAVYLTSRQQHALLRERVALAEDLRLTTDRYRLLAENASDLVFSINSGRSITWMSPSARSVLGYEPAELVGRQTAFIVHPDDMPIVEANAPSAGSLDNFRVRFVAKDGAARWGEVSRRRIVDERGKNTGGVIVSVRNIDEEMAAKAAFEHELAFDGLTGLPRREVALQRIGEVIAQRQGRPWALICVGVGGMTQINQAFTYAAGDHVLRVVADRLVGSGTECEHVARIAGDEFVIVTPELASAAGAASIAEHLLGAVRGSVSFGDVELEISACMGIAMADGHDAEELLRDASAAMRQATDHGMNRWEFLDGDVGEQTRTLLQVQAEMRAALTAGSIEAWYMPIVGLPGREVVGYESLVRWRREDGSVWTPDLFLGVAERSGLILDIDRAMFRQIQAAALRAADAVRFAYNVSAASLASESFADWVIDELQASGVDPRRLKFEITETAIFHVTPGITQTMEKLTALGIDWWVDDFGTGFSSISHLRDLPIAGIKLDKSFTAELEQSVGQAAELAAGLLGLARGLKLEAVAEGVETDEQERALLRQGWPLAQGWLYARPAPAHW